MIEINHENIEPRMTAFTASNDLSIIKANIAYLMFEKGYVLTNLNLRINGSANVYKFSTPSV